MPHYLHDRPPSLINHCLDRLSSAVEIGQECIHMTDEERGTFKVKSLDPNTQGCWYSLSFGDDETMPHCECVDWEKHRLPCKHFLAVFRHFKGWGFDKFPTHYRESPFLTLDHVVVFRKEPVDKMDEEETVEDVIQENEVHGPNVNFDEKPSKLPVRPKSCRTWNTKCKEAIKQVTSLTHIVDDTESLKELYTFLHDCINVLSNAAQKEEGLVLEKPRNKDTSKSSTSKSTTSKSGTSSSFKENENPKRKTKTRNPFSGRHGERAEIMKRTFKVNVDVTAGEPVPKRTKKSDCIIETEVVSMDLDYKAEPVTSDPNPAQTSTSPTDEGEAQFTTCTKPDVEPGVQAAPKPQNLSTAEPDTHCTAGQPAACTAKPSPARTTKPPAAPTAVAPATATAVPPATYTTVPPATCTSVPQATRTAVPPAAATTVPPATCTAVPPATCTAVPPAAPTAERPATRTAVPPAAPTTIPPATTTTVPPATPTAAPPAAPRCVPSSTASPIIIDDNSPDPRSWVKIENCCPDDPDYKLVLYLESKTSILKMNYWLADSEIHAGQLLLKKHFPYVDGVHDPAIKGSLVVPATSEFVQILNTGSHWVCTISTTPGTGTVKIFDSMYQKPNSITVEHACRMLMYLGSKVTFINEKVQRQVGASDCGLFSLAFATDLCHGLDPAHLRYDQGSMRRHYVNCLANGAMVPFPRTTRRVLFHLGCNKSTVAIYCMCRLPYDKDEYVQCSYKCKAWYHPTCVNVPAWALNSGRKWRCSKCKDAAKGKSVPLCKI